LKRESLKPQDVILKVVRGELPLSTLESVGVHATFGEDSYQEHTDAPLEVDPAASDIASGLVTYSRDPGMLKRWAQFMMGTNVISLERINNHPQADLILSALWDASFAKPFNQEVLGLANG